MKEVILDTLLDTIKLIGAFSDINIGNISSLVDR